MEPRVREPKERTGIVLGFSFGNLGIKSHLDVGVTERQKVYYMGEDGGFPSLQVVINQVSPELFMAYPSTKGAPECELTNLLVGLMQV